jgi:hypothetical protein
MLVILENGVHAFQWTTARKKRGMFRLAHRIYWTSCSTANGTLGSVPNKPVSTSRVTISVRAHAQFLLTRPPWGHGGGIADVDDPSLNRQTLVIFRLNLEAYSAVVKMVTFIAEHSRDVKKASRARKRRA